jgi:hypothetical protein
LGANIFKEKSSIPCGLPQGFFIFIIQFYHNQQQNKKQAEDGKPAGTLEMHQSECAGFVTPDSADKPPACASSSTTAGKYSRFYVLSIIF